MRQDEPLGEREIEELENFLLSDAVPEEYMDISMLHGFLTALIAGPSVVAPSEWLPVVWGDDGPVFDSLDQANRMLDLMMRMNNSIIRMLQAEPPSFRPIIQELETAEGKVECRADEWCRGFIIGTHLRAEEWDDLVGDKENYIFMVPILALADKKALDVKHAVEKDKKITRAKMMANIPVAVAGIYDYWRPRRMERAGHVTADGAHVGRVGRNEPCPCGSGRKFKKCCGGGSKLGASPA